ncbi:MAG: bile acid:sodium symporter family protein [Bryobacterales bacterium]|jgi:bile acid:Na+ symporter, BASS family|nr:bile acid:sodium symporter family protein [Bryobacterales bacterium]
MSSRLLPTVSALAGAAAVAAWISGAHIWIGPALIAAFASLGLYARTSERLGGFAFTIWVFAFVSASMAYPEAFIDWGGFELKRLILPLIQIIMFGMGTSLSLTDFKRALQKPKAVGVCMLLQFSVMPLAGWTLAKLFGFEPEVAAGVILIGSCSAGVASNVMVYLAKGSLALGVTMTTASTLLAPVMTPLAMKVLAGAYVPISFMEMMLEIIKMIILPVFGGLAFNKLLHGRIGWLDRILPTMSMSAICFIIAIITALSRDKLLEVGLALIAAAMIHNVIGYVLGYNGARLLGLSERDSRTVAFEVGLQNGGMASGLAINVLRSSDAALAPAIFGPWMNISGSSLASYWRRRPVTDEDAATTAAIEAAQRLALKKRH